MAAGGYFEPDLFLKFLLALIALLNPLYGIPVFLSVTEGFSPEERNRTAVVATLAVTATALVALLVGEEVLAVFGVNVPSFRIAGGIIVLGIALSMLRADDRPTGDARAADAARSERRNVAVVPLAIPLTIGPGAIATAIVFAHQIDDAGELLTLVPVVLIVCGLVGLGYRFADPIAARLGQTVLTVVTRIMAIILAAVAVEMVAQGVIDVIDGHYPGLSGGAAGR